jgi:hypothetical protein
MERGREETVPRSRPAAACLKLAVVWLGTFLIGLAVTAAATAGWVDATHRPVESPSFPDPSDAVYCAMAVVAGLLLSILSASAAAAYVGRSRERR